MKTLTEYRKDAVLDKRFNFGEDGTLTRRQWLQLKASQGWAATYTKEHNLAAEATLEQWIFDHRGDNSGNSNWPATNKWLVKKEMLKAGVFKDVYKLEKDSGVYIITKIEYDYFKEITKTITA